VQWRQLEWRGDHHDNAAEERKIQAMLKDITVKELVENDMSSNFVPDLHSSVPVLSQNQNVIQYILFSQEGGKLLVLLASSSQCHM
jgi:hypothetical protein